MKYMGSKARFTKEILPLILRERSPEQYYVEPFAGGMNAICEVAGNRIANDSHFYLIKMWERLVCDWIPEKITREKYNEVKNNQNNFSPHFVGWVGFNCSYSGKWFGGFAGETKTKIGTIRDYQVEAIKNVLKQVPKMEGVLFQTKSYDQLELPPRSIIYCDPPYAKTTEYVDGFNHIFFWDWIRNINKQGHTIFVSEYNAPNDFECIWQKKVKSSLSANGKHGGNKISTERLFRHDTSKDKELI